MLIDWSDQYAIGIPRIDEQHKFFFQVVHRLHKECLANEGEDAVLETLVFLESYVRKHFQAEEAFMREHEYPRVEEHGKLHVAFLERYLELIEEFKLEPMRDYLARVRRDRERALQGTYPVKNVHT